MADISLRFHKDMLVCTTPVAAILERQGADVDNDLEMLTLAEPECLEDAYRLEMATEAQCLVAETSHLLPCKLLYKRLEGRMADLVESSMELALERKPQHVLVEMGPSGLPLDPSSKASLVEVRDQYARAAKEFEKHPFDAYLLHGFADPVELKCALMGLRKASDKPVMACITVDDQGNVVHGEGNVESVASMMAEYGASVVGMTTGAAPEQAAKLAKRMGAVCDLPLMVQLDVRQVDKRQGQPTPENPYFYAETMFGAIPHLRSAGVQFVRAVGKATPAYAGALAAILAGLDVIDTRGILGD